jgi:hypothetical protein
LLLVHLLAACKGDEGDEGDEAPAADAGEPDAPEPDADVPDADVADAAPADAGVCMPSESIEVATGFREIYDLDVVGPYVYVAHYDGVAQAEGCGGGQIDIHDFFTTTIAVDQAGAYYVDPNGDVHRVAPGSDPIVHDPTSGTVSLAADAEAAYALDAARVVRIPHAGGMVTTVAGPNPSLASGWIDVRAGRVYFLAYEVSGAIGLYSAEVDGDDLTLLASDVTSAMQPAALTVDEAFVYVTNSTGIGRVPLGGGALEPLVAVDSLGPQPTPVAFDATCVYYVSHEVDMAGKTNGKVTCLPKGGGTGSTKVFPEEIVRDVVVDGAYLYIALTPQTSSLDYSGHVVRVPVP